MRRSPARLSLAGERRLARGSVDMADSKYEKRSVNEMKGERSTCGIRQRLFTKDDGAPASITYLAVDDAKSHWHKYTHEYYYVLEGEGALFIDGERVAIAPGDCLWIKPGVRHYAEGAITSLIVAMPALDPADIFYAEPTPSEQQAHGGESQRISGR